MIVLLVTGILAGAVHVVSGPDHFAAVAPLATQSRTRPWIAGLRWGLGHATGVLAISAAALLLREALPLERFSAWSERLVGVALIGVGLWGLRLALRERVHRHRHEHGGRPHEHVHFHRHGHAGPGSHRHEHAAFGVGALHGFAGSAHFLAVLPALALPSRAAAAVYLTGYGTGSVAAMTLFTVIFGWILQRSTRSDTHSDGSIYRKVTAAVSSVAVTLGVFWLVRG